MSYVSKFRERSDGRKGDMMQIERNPEPREGWVSKLWNRMTSTAVNAEPEPKKSRQVWRAEERARRKEQRKYRAAKKFNY